MKCAKSLSEPSSLSDSSTEMLVDKDSSAQSSLDVKTLPIDSSTEMLVDRDSSDQSSTAFNASLIAGSEYASKSSQYISLVDRLRQCGAHTEVNLPRICVVGVQSAGKSSLIEAISGINLPRASGTCTRCPFEVRLSKADTFSCDVHIRPENMEKDRAAEARFCDTIVDKEQVPHVLRRAQLAVLNPDQPSSKYLEEMAEEQVTVAMESSKLQFSKTVICIDVKGPDQVSLSFVDLPGLIVSTKDDNSDLVEQVSSMVKSYIKEDCIILQTVTMTADMENQQSVKLVRDADPKGERTIGVLTKADAVAKGDEASWLKVLDGTIYPLKLGWYATVSPSTALLEEGITWEAARRHEQRFFQNKVPWNLMSAERLGTAKLVVALSKQLTSQIKDRLPAIINEVESKFKKTDADLKALPNPPTHPSKDLHDIITRFDQDFKQQVAGFQTQLLVQINRCYARLEKKLRSSAPSFSLNSDDIYRPCIKSEADCEAVYKWLDIDAGRLPSGSRKYDVSGIERLIEQHRTRETPEHVPFAVNLQLFREVIEPFESLNLACIDEVSKISQAILEQLVLDYCGQFKHLHMAVGTFVARMNDEVFAHCRKDISRNHQDMQRTLQTRNDHYFSSKKQVLMTELKLSGQEEFSDEEDDEEAVARAVTKAISALKQLGIPATEQTLRTLKNEKNYHQAFSAMAETFAFWHVKYKFVIDHTQQRVYAALLYLHDHLQQDLMEELGLFGPDASEKADKLMVEDRKLHDTRRELQIRVKALGDARQELNMFRMA